MTTLKNLTFLLMTAVVFTTISCKEEEKSGIEPVANFAFKIKSDLTVTFTNNSEDAEIYAWDFGDGATSTEESPSHKYTSAIKVTVTLTVTNGDFSNTMTKEVDLTKAPIIDIDGVFTDWASITTSYTIPTTVSLLGITTVKIASDDNYIYFYAELVKSVTANFSLYFQKDENSVNTYIPWMYGGTFVDCFAQWYGLQRPNWESEVGKDEKDINLAGYDKSWGTTWPSSSIDLVPAESGLWEISGIKPITSTFEEHELVALEISMKKSLVPALGSKLKVGFYMQNEGWADAGCCPGPAHATTNSMFTYDLITKMFE